MTLSDWASLGSAVGGFATAILVVVGFVVGLPGIRDWRARLKAQKDMDDEQTHQIVLERRRHVEGWSPGMINGWEVANVTDPAEIERAEIELTTGGGYSAFVLLKAADPNQANNLRQIVARDGQLAREPTAGEREALDRGFVELGVPTAQHSHQAANVTDEPVS
jgi:hypothetical protein